MARQKKSSVGAGSFLLLAFFAVLMAAVLIVMFVLFGRNPDLAPPGICKHIAFAVPAILMLLLLVAMIQRVRAISRGE